MRKRDLERLLKKYSANSIASVLGLSPSTVRGWITRGVPKSRETSLKTLQVAKRREGYEEKALREMMVLAKSTGKLPSPKKYSKRRDAERTYGWEVSQPIQGFLNEGMLMKIQTGLESAKLSRGFPNFLASIQMSVLAGDTTIYVAGPVRVQVDHTEADDFIVDAIESSGIQHSKREAIASVVGKLRQKMSTDARFYIHGIGFSSYEYKDK